MRRRRLQQLRAMTDEQFAAEVRHHQGSQWRSARLLAHARSHAEDFEELLGRQLSPPELEALSRGVLRAWDRLFTELQSYGITYYFLRSLPDPDSAIIVITRGGYIRTVFPTATLSQLWRRRPAAIEVTGRAKGLGLSD